MKNKALGIIFANMHDSAMGELTARRSMASLPVGGRYRMVDFSLSAMVAAGISSVGVIAKSNYQSLLDHLGSGRSWDLVRKNQGLIVFPPHSYYGSNDTVYHGRIEALRDILDYLKNSDVDHVVMTDCDYLCNLDYSLILEAHEQTNADITIACCELPDAPGATDNCVMVKADADGRVQELMFNRAADGFLHSMNLFVLGRDLLVELIEDASARMLTNFERDILMNAIDRYNVRVWKHSGFVCRMNNLRSYYNASMSLLDRSVMQQLFPKERPVYTKVRDEAPVRYGVNSHVNNSLIADGCVIEGTVENCVLFRGVKVGRDAALKNCIVMQGTVIEDGASLSYIITDKDVVIGAGRSLLGDASYPVYIKKASKV